MVSWGTVEGGNHRDFIFGDADTHYSARGAMSCDGLMGKSSDETILMEEPEGPAG